MVLLAACSTVSADPQVHGITPGHQCRTDGTDGFIGRLVNSGTGAAIKRVSRAAVLRWAPPGVMLTMDYREDRVTVWLDGAKKIVKIRCG